MDKSKLAVDVYDKIALDYAKEFDRPSEYIDKFIKYLPSKAKILDAGCGVGVDSKYLSSKKFNVIGVDLSSSMLKIAQKNSQGVEFVQNDIRNLNFESSHLDCVVSSFSLIHIPKQDILELLSDFSNFLKPNGLIYLGLQSGESKEIFIDEPFKPDEKIFLNIISEDEIIFLLNKVGFKIIEIFSKETDLPEELNLKELYIIAKNISKV